MFRVEFPQMISGFFRKHVSKSLHKFWDLEHFRCYQKSTLPLSEEGALTICLLHTALTLKHPRRCWYLTTCPSTTALLLLLYYCPWHCYIHTTAPSQVLLHLLLKRIINHPHLFPEVNKLCSSEGLGENVYYLFSCGNVLQLHCSPLDTVFDKMAPDVNVFPLIMKN